MDRNVVVVGGGLAGLAASIYLARGGCRVTVFEKRRFLGGRALTTLRHAYRFNLGAHAFYRGGAGAAVYRELGIPIRGAELKARAVAMMGSERPRLPRGVFSLLGTSLLSVRGKSEMLSAFFHVWRFAGTLAREATVREWLDARFSDERARRVFEALIRLATYSDHADAASAALALSQMKIALKGTLYIDEGWQKIVDSLHSAAISSGVNFVTSSRIVGVEHDGTVRAVELGGLELDSDRMDTQALAMPEMTPEQLNGTRLPAEHVLLAVDPVTAADLVGTAGAGWTSARPVTAACLDVALKTLPRPKNLFALGIDRPLYLSVHSAAAQLTPKGGALIHVAKYRREQRGSSEELDGTTPRRSESAAAEEQELEAMLDEFQPGWKDVLVHRRFLPAMTVSNALVSPSSPRPAPVVEGIRGLYIAGDWVGSEGMLSDAALASARAAAKAILAG